MPSDVDEAELEVQSVVGRVLTSSTFKDLVTAEVKRARGSDHHEEPKRVPRNTGLEVSTQSRVNTVD